MADLNLIPETKKERHPLVRTVSQNTFLVFAVVVFIATASLWGGMMLYQDTLQDEIQFIKSDIAKTEGEIRAAGDVESRLRSLNQKLVSLETLLDQHPYPTTFFDFLEETTHPQVKYSHLSLSVREREAILSGTAASYGILAEQLAAINKSNLATFSNLGNIGISEKGGISFGLNLLLHPNIFEEPF